MARYKITVDRDVVVKREHYEIEVATEEELYAKLDQLVLEEDNPKKVEELSMPQDEPYVQYAEIHATEHEEVEDTIEQSSTAVEENVEDIVEKDTLSDGVLILLCPETGLAYAGNPHTGERHFIFDHCLLGEKPESKEYWNMQTDQILHTDFLKMDFNLDLLLSSCPYFNEIADKTTNQVAKGSIDKYRKSQDVSNTATETEGGEQEHT
jgi:hypothetical protein